VLGVYDVFGGGPEAALRHATQTPVNDPLLLVPAMAAATEHLGSALRSRFPMSRRFRSRGACRRSIISPTGASVGIS
jgi:hypothetical protein